jgi:asparagine synthase (glutamine-hydrolysing)
VANFVALVDPDPERRAAFLAAAEPRLAILPGLVAGCCTTGDFAAAWAAGPRAPLSHHACDGGAALLFGDAIRGASGERLDAPALGGAWRQPDAALPPALDGYHAGLAFQPGRGLVCGGDILGWFPLYWLARGDVLLVASSPELLPLHPRCRTTLDPAALVGTLMLNGLVGTRPLLAPIRRLSPGHLLTWSPTGGACERRQYALADAWRGEELPWQAYVEILDAALAGTMRRHVGGDAECGLMLSGGLDSRMLAGYLHRQGTEVTALTQGIASDIELRCATRVARTLRFTHRRFDPDVEELPTYAARSAGWEHLAGGFSSVIDWSWVSRLEALPRRVVAGYGFDHVLHANAKPPAAALRSGVMPFAEALKVRNLYGLQPELLGRLLRPESGRDLVDPVLDELTATYDGLATSGFRRYWAFSLIDRVRNHIGLIAWRLSFGAWPVLPLLDRALLDAIGGMPIAALSGRRLQVELVRTRFPALAALPLDRNSHDDRPLEPRVRDLVRRGVAGQLAPLRRLLPGGRVERRFFWRTYDFDGPGWRAVRRRAEPHRARLHALVQPAVLDEVLPTPDGSVAAGRLRPHRNGLKLLLGLMLWLESRS